jgi:hypothetical protein
MENNNRSKQNINISNGKHGDSDSELDEPTSRHVEQKIDTVS